MKFYYSLSNLNAITKVKGTFNILFAFDFFKRKLILDKFYSKFEKE